MTLLKQEEELAESTPLLRDQCTVSKKEESWKDLKGRLMPLFASFYMSIIAGFNDGCLGAIIPRVKEYYRISNGAISVLFLCSALGFFISASANGTLVHRFGQYRVLVCGSCTVLAAYIVIMSGVPFPLMGVAMVFVGMGMAVLDAGMNVYTANLPFATLLLNILHALYGVGAMFSPLVATYLLKNDISWKGIYVFLSCTCLINVISIIISFWNVDKEVPEEEEILDNVDHREITKAAIFHPMTLLGAAYILVYMGFEVTLGGWGYTFLTEGIYGDPIAMEKVVSCYWMGLAASPILLGYLVSRFGEKLMITLLTLMVLCGMMVLIVSKDIVLDSTAFISIGFLTGPMFPSLISITSKVLPRSYHATSIGFIAAAGSGGAGIFPFLTGQITAKFGLLAVPVACLIMTFVMMCIWILLPSDRPFFDALRTKTS